MTDSQPNERYMLKFQCVGCNEQEPIDLS